jgi:hypothetical protein
MKKIIGVLVEKDIAYSNKDRIVYIHKYNEDGTLTVYPIDRNKSYLKQIVERENVIEAINALTLRDTQHTKRHNLVNVVKYKKHFKLIKVFKDGYVTELRAFNDVLLPGDSILISSGSKLRKEFHNKSAEVITIHTNGALTVKVKGSGEIFRMQPCDISATKSRTFEESF